MAKNKNQNIVIKDEELVPTTIGVYSNKTKSPIALFFMVAIFLALLIFLPNVQSLYNKYIVKVKPEDTQTNNNNNNNNNTEDDIEEVVKYDIASNPVIIKEGVYTVSNISLNQNMLAISIANNSKDTLDLDDYYLELYNDNDTFVERVKVSNKSLEPSASDNFVLTISSKPTKIVFIKRLEENYPVVTLAYDENSEAIYTCSKGVEKYSYKLLDDKLSSITYVYSATNVTDQHYSYEKLNKQKLAQTYNEIDGVDASLIDNESGYTLTVSIDLSQADISLIDLDGLFKMKTNPSVIKFKEEAKGYTCKQ